MKRAVVILPEPPCSPKAGNAVRDRQQIELLCRLGYRVSLLCVRPRLGSTAQADRAAAGRWDIDVEFVAETPVDLSEPIPAQLRRKLGYLFQAGRDHPFAWWAKPYGLAGSLPYHVKRLDPAIVVLRSFFLGHLPMLRAATSAPLIVDCHDAEVDLARGLVGCVSWWRMAGLLSNWAGVRAVYRRNLGLADEIWAVSEGDARALRRVAGRVGILVVPSAVDERLVVPAADPGPDDTCALVANYGYGPNLDGARWLVERVWPAVWRERERARLLLVGSGAEEELSRQASRYPGVEATGWVPDLAGVYAASGVMLAPLFHGGGSRLKVVEAWKHGKAVLGTPKGLEGLDAPGTAAVCATTPEAFAVALAALLRDRASRAAVAEAGRQFVAAHLTFEGVLPRLLAESVAARVTCVGR